jgi:N-acyl-D-aspartate/D-glutamate deacylase
MAASSIENPGYHLTAIEKGEVGELSKVHEEVLEALDAQAQGVDLMVLIELSDLLGAVEMYLERHHPSLTLEDLQAMARVTRRAFTSGRRS